MTKESTEENWDIYYSLPFFDPVFKKMSRKHFDYFYYPLIGKLGFKTTLEFGGGTGHLSMRIKKLKGSKVTILDHNKKARQKHRKEYNGKTNYVIGDVFETLLGKKFDLVFSDGLVEHFKEPKQSELIRKHCELSDKYVIIAAPKPTIYSEIFSRIVCYEKGMQPKEVEEALIRNGFKIKGLVDNKRYFSVLAERKA